MAGEKWYEVGMEIADMMGADNLVEELLQAMDNNEARDNLCFIDRMNDLGLTECEDVDV
mgnify:CR=1 FL=1